MAVLVMVQNACAALSITDRNYVMETEQVVIPGLAVERIADARSRQANLGV